MREMLDEKLARFESLEKQMSDPEILADSNKMAAVAREHGGLVKLAGTYKRFLEICDELQSAEEMLKGDDAEMAELAEAEIPELRAQREQVWQELLDLTVGGDDANH